MMSQFLKEEEEYKNEYKLTVLKKHQFGMEDIMELILYMRRN
jgi:hypothetical protein